MFLSPSDNPTGVSLRPSILTVFVYSHHFATTAECACPFELNTGREQTKKKKVKKKENVPFSKIVLTKENESVVSVLHAVSLKWKQKENAVAGKVEQQSLKKKR